MILTRYLFLLGEGFPISRATEEDLQRAEQFLERVRALLPTNQCTFILTDKNRKFDHDFNLTHKEKMNIIKSLTADDFVEIKHNEYAQYADTDLYIFHKLVKLIVYGEEEEKTVYIKGYILEDPMMDMVIVLSFHEAGMHD